MLNMNMKKSKSDQNQNQNQIKTSLLNPNHSHFLLVDDAKHTFGGEINFRAELEATIAKKFNAPIVLLVIAGGPKTLESVNEAVQKGTPCVFLEVNSAFTFTFISLLPHATNI